MLRLVLVLGIVGISIVGALSPVSALRAQRLMYVGTYTGPQSKGIYAFRFDDGTGALTPIGLVAETPSPSFLTASADGRFVFAVNEISSFGGEPSGSVTSFAVDPATSKLTAINTQSTRGAGPCHLMLDRTGRFLAVANYGGGNFAILPVDSAGRLGEVSAVLTNSGSGPNQQRQQGPHAHMVLFDPDNRFLYGADLGLDRVFVYRFDQGTGKATPNSSPFASVAAGAGPRHLAWHPNGRFAYVINELASTITMFAWNRQAGTLTGGSTVSTLPQGFSGTSSTAEIAVHPNGKFLYGSNRGHDSIAVFSIGASGELHFVEAQPTRGRTPRNFTIDPTGQWLIAANQDSNTIAVFRIDTTTGALRPVGDLSAVGAPVSLLFMK
jgi:6-phosphogluconolactonase